MKNLYSKLSNDARDLLTLLRKQFLEFGIAEFNIPDLPGNVESNIMKLYELQSRGFGVISKNKFVLDKAQISNL